MLVHGYGFRARQLQRFYALVHAEEFQFGAGLCLKGQRVTASARADVERITFLWQLDVLVHQLGKALAPVSRDVEVFEEGQFFFRFRIHSPTCEPHYSLVASSSK